MKKNFFSIVTVTILFNINLFGSTTIDCVSGTNEIANNFGSSFTVSGASVQYQPSQKVVSNGVTNCIPEVYTIDNCLLKTKVLKTVDNTLICADFLIDRDIKSQSAYMATFLNDATFRSQLRLPSISQLKGTVSDTTTVTNLYKDETDNWIEVEEEVKGTQALTNKTTEEKILELYKSNKEISENINTDINNLSDGTSSGMTENLKRSFAYKLLNDKIYNPNNYYSLEKLKDPINISFEPRSYQGNTIFQECQEARQKIPSINLTEMLDIIKQTIFDLEGEIEGSVTNYIDNIKNSILDVTSDEAMLTYAIQAFSNIIAVAVCKFKQVTIDKIKAEGTEQFCKTAANTNDSSTTGGNKEAINWTGLFGTITSGTTIIGSIKGYLQNIQGASSDGEKTACEQKAQSLLDDSYEKCMNEEPEKIKNFIIGLLKQQVNVGKIEVETLNTCTDEEMRKNFTNKNIYDNAGKPYQNKITNFLNQNVDFLQNNVRDLALSVLQKSLLQVSLEAKASQIKATPDELIQEARKTSLELNLYQRFPDLSPDKINDYVEKGTIFLQDLENKGYNTYLKNAVKLLTFNRTTTAGTTYNDFIGTTSVDKGMLGRLTSLLNYYDFMMNYWFGADLSIVSKPVIDTISGANLSVNVEKAEGNYSGIESLPNSSTFVRVMKLFVNTSSDAIFNDKVGTARELKKIQEDSIKEFYTILMKVIEYMENDFTFEHKIIKIYDSSTTLTNIDKLTYSMPVDEIKDVILKELNKIYLKRYSNLKDKNGVKLEGYDINYIVSQINEINTIVSSLKTSTREADKEELNNYLLKYYKLLLDYNLFEQTLALNNENSIMAIVNETNMRIGSMFSNFKGYQIDMVALEFENFLALLNK